MAPRPRKPGAMDLPPNLYHYGGSWVYRRPDTGERRTLKGVTDRNLAILAARELNARLQPLAELKARAAAEHVLGDTQSASSFGALADRFVREFLPGRKLAGKTLADYTDRITKLAGHFGAARLVNTIETEEIATYLDARPANSGNKDRALLLMFWKYAMSKGATRNNPVEATFRAHEDKQRQRLDIEAFRAIRSAAEPWFQIALDLAIVTLQRRGDLVGMRYDDIRDGRLYVEQGKVERHGTGRIAQRIGPQLAEIIARSRTDDIASPFIVHRRPLRRRREYLDGKEHWTQVEAEMLSREFQRLRDAQHLYDAVPPAQRPTFHELRSLGAALYRDAGIDPQHLLGHEDAGMTEHYLAGHWTQFEHVATLPITG